MTTAYTEGEEYAWDRWASSRTEIINRTIDDTVQLLEQAIANLRYIQAAPTSEAAAGELYALHNILDQGQWLEPTVEAWCVVKHYHDHVPGEWAWQPAVWSAHFTKEDAELYATVVRRKYSRWLDRFEVERAQARATQFKIPVKKTGSN